MFPVAHPSLAALLGKEGLRFLATVFPNQHERRHAVERHGRGIRADAEEILTHVQLQWLPRLICRVDLGVQSDAERRPALEVVGVRR